MSFCVIEINKYCINSNNTFINLLNILLDYITNTNNLSTLYRFFRLNSFMTCLDRIKYQCHSSVAQKKTIIIKQSDSNITGDRNNSSSSSVDREREKIKYLLGTNTNTDGEERTVLSADLSCIFTSVYRVLVPVSKLQSSEHH